MTAPLAPALGRLAAPPSASPWETIRLAMVDDLVSANAAGRLDDGAWLAAWGTAASALRDSVLADGRQRLESAAAYSRYPASRLERLLPDAGTAERLLQRLLAEGTALEELEDGTVGAEANRRRGAALETAWDGAVRVATVESARLRAEADRVREWRRPWRPLVIGGGIVTAVTMVVAAMVAGVVPAPGWFEPVVDWFWRWPWP